MTVSRKRHYIIVGTLSLVIVILTIILSRFLMQNKPQDYDPISPETLDFFTRPFLQAKEVFIIPPELSVDEDPILEVEDLLFEYVEITDSCGPHYEGECVLVRTGPGTEFDVATKLRNGIILKVGGKVTREDKTEWYQIVFDEWLRYPDRVKSDWYVSADLVEILYDEGDLTIWEDEYSTTSLKKIVVDKSEQTLTAYEDDLVYMEIPISTGLELTPTPNGTFSVFKKTPSRYMQGPLPNLTDKQVYDLPGVPWNLYFTHGGAVIHGAYWHDSFGTRYSHGCVNLSPNDAKKLYYWTDLGTRVEVKS